MKKKIILIIIFAIVILLIAIKMNKKEEINNQEIKTDIQNELNAKNDENPSIIENQEEIEDLKQQYNLIGENEIYNVETESDGRKVLNIKPNVNFKVAFVGMIKNKIPNFEELDSVFESNSPKKAGIWIKKENRKEILAYLNNNLNCKYEINDDGYLQIKKKNNENTIDQKIEKLINGNKQYIFCISSTSYMVDPVTGEIIDNPYNQLEPYQTYEYFEDEDRMIIFITENKDSKMTKDEIIDSIIELLE